MDRRDFLKNTSLSGLGLALMPTLVQSCRKNELDDIDVNFSGKVLIIGAGAAGMMAAYTCQQYGIDFEIVEAGPIHGGRVRKNETLMDFPLDIGAEWLHDQPSALGRLINDENAQGSVDLVSYQPEVIQMWNGDSLVDLNFGSHFYREYKFKSSTWWDFFNDFIVPSIASKMVFNQPIESIDYNADQIIATATTGDTFTGDKLVLTVPVAILQQEVIDFSPALPSATMTKINNISMPDGIKVFMRFSQRFYPDILQMGEISSNNIYFDGAFKKDTNQNLLSFFWVEGPASALTSLTDAEIFTTIMAELDDMFDGKATQYYEDHLIQNWSNEPFVRGSYSHDGWAGGEELAATPVSSKIYFAGEAYRNDAIAATVHGAGFSGRDAARMIIQGN